MDLVFEGIKKRIIKKEDVFFSLKTSGLYLIKIVARAKGEKQLQGTDDEDLRIEIDKKKFPQLKNPERYIDSPAAFTGGKLKGLEETIFFILPLVNGKHVVSLIPDQGADLESFKIFLLPENSFLEMEINNQAEDGDRRPWITFVLSDLPFVSITSTVIYSRRNRDSDDVKIIIDDHIQGNLLRNIKHFLWRFAGSLLSKDSSKTETEILTVNLPQGLHYIEFWADRMPILQNIILNFGAITEITTSVPTVDNPKWTGDFSSDTEDILLARLILGEAELQPKMTKIGIGFTVLNRLKKKNPNWGYSVREIILKDNQYDGMWNKYTYQKVRDPLSDSSETRRKEWQESYEVASDILSGKLSDSANGATNFHSFQDPKDFPFWATKEAFKIKLGNIYFYELEK